MLKRFVLFSLVAIVIFGVAFTLRGRQNTADAGELAAPLVAEDGVVRVGAIRFWRDYDANEIAADERYKGRQVRVTGRVLGVEKNLHGAGVLELVSGNALFRTLATLTLQETPRAAGLTRGDTVVVQCTGAGRSMRMPQLDDCELLRP